MTTREGQARAARAEGYAVVAGPGAIRLERVLPGPIERVWAYLTEADKRGEWLAAGEIELRVGGQVALRFQHADLSAEKTPPEKYRAHAVGSTVAGVVTRCEAPRRLSYTWIEGKAESEVSFELEARGGEVLLVLTHRRLATRADMVGVSTGWHSHLDILGDRLAGREPRPFWSTIARMEEHYEGQVPTGEPGRPA